MIFFNLFIALFLAQYAIADDFYTADAQGWLNYHYVVKTSETPAKTQKTPSPAEKMDSFHAYFNNVEDEAVMNPTEENVARYMALQNEVQNQSIRFSSTWEKVLLDQPEFDYELIHPTDQMASQIDRNNTSSNEKSAVAQLAKTYGMLFFYDSTDTYAQKMAGPLQYFADENGIALMGVSMDGIPLPDIKENQNNSIQAERMGIHYFPALFLVDTENKSFEPLAYGFIAQNQLLDRFYEVATHFTGQNLLTGTEGVSHEGI